MEDRAHDGRKCQLLNVIDDFTLECLGIRLGRKLKSTDVIIAAVGAKTTCIAPGSPWENGDIESFNARIRDEMLDGEIL